MMECKETRHSRESGNPEKHWIPGQARNDNQAKIHVPVLTIIPFFHYSNVPRSG
jgi:hypothetical protein